jgi:DNA repair protein RadC
METTYLLDSGGLIKTSPKPRRGPREKIGEHGIESLSDEELVRVLLGTGTRGISLEKLAARVLSFMDQAPEVPKPDYFKRIKGVGLAKASVLSAAMELGRRRYRPSSPKVNSADDIFSLVSHYADRKQERFIVVSLNGAHEALAVRVASIGLVNRTLIHPREVFADPLMDRAAAIAVAHNHPSGQLEPSQEDIEVTRRLAGAGYTLGINLLDHLIFSQSGFWSFAQEAPANLQVCG